MVVLEGSRSLGMAGGGAKAIEKQRPVAPGKITQEEDVFIVCEELTGYGADFEVEN
jgi:hypothetical protein